MGYFILITAIIVLFFIFKPKKDPKEVMKKNGSYYINSNWPDLESEPLMNLEVAGVKHYKGVVKPKDTVILTIDPDNEYDKNAIEVRNLLMDMIGYIPKTTNKKLLKIMESEDLFGIVKAVYRNHTEVHIELRKVISPL
jgi:hypothetical protein